MDANSEEISIVINPVSGRFVRFEGGKIKGEGEPYPHGHEPPTGADEQRWKRTEGTGIQAQYSVGAASAQLTRCTWVFHNGRWYWCCV